MRAMSPAGRIASPRRVGYTGSPIKDRVHLFEKAMRDSAGLRSQEETSEEEIVPRKTKDVLRKSQAGGVHKQKRKSSSVSLHKASAARKISLVLQQQDETNATPPRKAVVRVPSSTA